MSTVRPMNIFYNLPTSHIFIFKLSNVCHWWMFFYFIWFQVFHCHFNSNFFPLFLDKLLGDSISPKMGAFLLGVSFVIPHINNLYFLTLCRKYGVYSVIKWLFYTKLLLSISMMSCGPNWPFLVCIFIARSVEHYCKMFVPKLDQNAPCSLSHTI